jgi:hypothetical protein
MMGKPVQGIPQEVAFVFLGALGVLCGSMFSF